MNKKIGALGLLFFVLILMPIVFAVEIKVVTKPERDVVVSILDDNGDSTISFSNVSDEEGIIVFNYDTADNKLDLNVIVRKNGKFEYGGPKKFEDQKTIRTIVIDLEKPEVDETNDTETNETATNETVAVVEEPVVEEPVVEEPVVEEIVEETVVEEKTEENDVTGAVVSDNIKSLFLSKTAVYIIIIIAVIVVVVLAYIFRKKLGKKGSAGFKIKKMSDMKKEDKKPPRDPADYDRRLDNAEEKLKEAKEELDELKERKQKLKEIRNRYEKDREELKEMGEID